MTYKVFKVFVDGAEGTTGLKIHQYFQKREDIQLLTVDAAKRKNLKERLALIEEADVSFLCLPDQAAREIAALAPADCRILDTSTAHRTDENWVYGMPELCPEQRRKIRTSNRVAVPGCHATGVILLIKPLLAAGLVDENYPFFAWSLTGYSGGGKRMIARYEDRAARSGQRERNGIDLLQSPRQYGIEQAHKHLPEIQAAACLPSPPAFTPIVADYYSGMEVTLTVKGSVVRAAAAKLGESAGSAGKAGTDRTAEPAGSAPKAAADRTAGGEFTGPRELVLRALRDYYRGQPLIQVRQALDEDGFIAANSLAGSNRLEIAVGGNDENILLTAVYDNLGKGASGAAIQNMNIMLGIEEEKGLL